jgi:hypothetical protein
MGRKPKLADHQKRERIKRRDHGDETCRDWQMLQRQPFDFFTDYL